jgi:basic membrane lipoprotein Med (substrate-binding protein (PBP1-ABC) superfamily)
MRILKLVVLMTGLLTIAACVDRKQAGPSASNTVNSPAQQSAASKLPRFSLALTDLGLADGAFAREAAEALQQASSAGRIQLELIGKMPEALSTEAGAEDIGLPVPGGGGPGAMTLSEAQAVLQDLGGTDILVISSGYLLNRVLDMVAENADKVKAIVLLDEQGMADLPTQTPVPVFRIRYDIRHMAFVCGVTAASDAASAHFGILYAADDPQGEEFAAAAAAGARYQSNGSWVESIAVPVESSGSIEAGVFQRKFAELQAEGGPNWKPRRFILALGRATPAIANALSKKPTNAHIIGAYADYRMVRPARVMGCALKRPGKALSALLSRIDLDLASDDPVAALRAVTDEDGIFMVGLDEDAVSFTSFDLYTRYNINTEDVGKTVEMVIGSIRAGELNLDY